MGLFSKLRSTLGRLGTRASSIAGRVTARLPVRAQSFLGRAGKIGRRIARPIGRVARFTPVGRALSIGLIGATVISGIRKRRRGQRPSGTGAVTTAGTVGRLAGIKRAGLIAAGVGAAAFVAEQIAEKLGVRGGAGFIGRRPTAKRKPTKRKKRRKKAKRIPRHGHRIVRQKARTVVRSVRSKKSGRKKGKRVSFTTKGGKRVSFIAR